MSNKIEWTLEMDAMLGTDFDSTIGKKLGLSAYQVDRRRKELGIPGYKHKKHKWSKEDDALLGTMPIKAISEKLGVPSSQVQKRIKEIGVSNYGSSRKQGRKTKPPIEQAGSNRFTWQEITALIESLASEEDDNEGDNSNLA